jgi:hypothetical protein
MLTLRAHLGTPTVFCVVRIAHRFSFMCNVFWFVFICLRVLGPLPSCLIRLFRIIFIPSTFCYFCPPDHVISMECTALSFRCQCTQQKLQSICAVLTFDHQLKKILSFSVKDRYQLSYFICIKDNAETIASLKLNLFSLLLSASWKENDLPSYISDIRQIMEYRTPVFIQPFPWRLHITITYNIPHLRLWYADVVTVIALPLRRQDMKKTERGRNWHDSKQQYWSDISTSGLLFQWYATITFNIACFSSEKQITPSYLWK